MTEKRELVIVGAGGFGREVLGYAMDIFDAGTPGRVVGFADANPGALNGFDLAVGVLGDLDRIEVYPSTRFVVAVGDPAARRRLAAAVAARGGRLATLVHPTAYLAPGARLGPGCVVCPFALVGTAAAVGTNTAINIYASVGHDATVGQNCVFSPYATANGAVLLGDDVFLGTHATVTPGRRVGRGAKVGAGAVVTREVPAGALAVGNPAKSRVLFATAEQG